MSRLPNPNLPWPIPMAAVALIAEREGCRLRAYRCPAGRWTCGWGETEGVTPETVWTQEEADRRLVLSLGKFAGIVRALCKEPPTPNQLGAMVSLAYNIGPGWTGAVRPRGAKDGFAQSTVLKAHNRGDWRAAARAFALWNKATIEGVLTELDGLTARRAAEAALYLADEADAPRSPMPQAVQAESKLTSSPMNQTGAIAVGGGALSGFAQLGEAAGSIKGPLDAVRAVIVDTVGLPTQWVWPAILIIGGATIIYWRYKQRRGGWA